MGVFIFFAILLIIGIFIILYPFATIVGKSLNSHLEQKKPEEEQKGDYIDLTTKEEYRRN